MFTLIGCATSYSASPIWSKRGVDSVQLKKDKNECKKFVRKLITPGRGTRDVRVKAIDVKVGAYDNEKNRILVNDWCMENRGYKKQVKAESK